MIDTPQLSPSPQDADLVAFMVRVIDARLAVTLGSSPESVLDATARALRANAGPGALLFVLVPECDTNALTSDLAATLDVRTGPVAQALADLIAQGFGGHIDFVLANDTAFDCEAAWPLLRRGGVMVSRAAHSDIAAWVQLGNGLWMARKD
ncbi:MAG: hypothetical protein RL186_802 [Pseudomonadota bacterium]